MKPARWLPYLAVLVALTTVVVGGLGPMDYDKVPDFDESVTSDTLLIDVADNLSREQQQAFIDSLGVDATLNSAFSDREGLYRVDGEPARLRALRDRLAGDARIEFVEFEQQYESYGVRPNDPLYPFQWNFQQIDVESAWKRADGRDTVVAVIDTGVVFDGDASRGYPAMKDLEQTHFVPGYDFVDDDDFPFDEHGHGTHVAGTIAQSTGNRYGVAGIAPAARIMPIRVLDADGRGSTANIAEAIRFAADNGADIINMSLGGPLPSQLMTDAINYAHRKGVTVIAAAGNNGWSLPSFPAANPHVLAVSATQYDRTTTFYSNHGPYIDLAAPGGNTRVDQNDDGRPDGIMQETLAVKDPSKHEFALYMGTSMASPHVAGVAALIHSQGITRPERIESILFESASKNVPSYTQNAYGAGIVDAGAAIANVYNQHRAPLWLLFLTTIGALYAGRERRRGMLTRGTVGVAAVFGLVLLSGLEPLDFLLSSIGVHGLLPAMSLAGWHEAGMGLLPLGILDHALLWSVAPVLLFWALFAHSRSTLGRGMLVGGSLAWASMLTAEALAPTLSLSWMPHIQWLESTWLLGNALLIIGIVWIASRDR